MYHRRCEEKGPEKKDLNLQEELKCRKDSDQNILIPESKKPTWPSLIFQLRMKTGICSCPLGTRRLSTEFVEVQPLFRPRRILA